MRRFNTPAVMLARAFYVLHLLAAFAGAITLPGAAARHDGEGWFLGCAALGLSASLRLLLYLRRQLARCERSFDSLGEGGACDDGAAEEFEALLERRDALELRRGTAGFDPWEILSLQRRINEHVRRNPGLEPLLRVRD